MDNTVSELRKAGNLAKAYELAKNGLNESPKNLSAKISMAWVLHDYLKAQSSNTSPLQSVKVLKEIRKLGPLHGAALLYDQIAFWTGTALLNHSKSKHPESELIEQLFQSIEDFPFPKPSKQYTWLLTGFLAHWENWSGFIGLMNWWGWENFREEDFLTTTKYNKQYLSIVEKLIGRYTKIILQKAVGNELPHKVLSNLCHSLLRFMEQQHSKCKNYTFYPYYKAKVLFLIGEKNKAKACFLPFAKKRIRDFWVWELLSQLETEPEMALAYQVKAVSVKTKPEFLAKVREDLVNRIIPINQDWAKTELERIIKLREKNGWPLTNGIKEKMAEKWYLEGKIISTKIIYQQYSEIANREFLENPISFKLLINGSKSDTKQTFGLNPNKETIKLITRSLQLQTGQAYEIVGQQAPNGWIFVHQAKKFEDDRLFSNWIITKSGKFTMHPSKQFGFVKDIFIPPSLLIEFCIEDGVLVRVKAIQSFDKKKKSGDGKAIQ
ncbi:DUF7017 domain-containing protein [Cyclobacterium qasimii]|uniref:TOTE conflict systems S1/CSD-like domain-containing protein n=1 Tax=Cyclobacterium qasimii M12-11B TaxID=641524 RepID=S7X0Y8_9BACT|nr:hypothetical protein [Cyclobacterium qasimii]EPR69793.1 hypothetical protein ADICYQ_1234 [Cyclobacterium qasimii M12-11B]